MADRMPKTRRTVIIASRAPHGGHTKCWAYGYEELRALLVFKSVGSVRNAVAAGAFDPSDLASIFDYLVKRQARAVRAAARRRKDQPR